MPAALHTDLARLRDVAAPGVDDAVLARALAVWTQMFGLVNFELFGHLHNVVEAYDELFDVQMRAAWRYLTGA